MNALKDSRSAELAVWLRKYPDSLETRNSEWTDEKLATSLEEV